MLEKRDSKWFLLFSGWLIWPINLTHRQSHIKKLQQTKENKFGQVFSFFLNRLSPLFDTLTVTLHLLSILFYPIMKEIPTNFCISRVVSRVCGKEWAKNRSESQRVVMLFMVALHEHFSFFFCYRLYTQQKVVFHFSVTQSLYVFSSCFLWFEIPDILIDKLFFP